MNLIQKHKLLKEKLKLVTCALEDGNSLKVGNRSLNVFEMAILQSDIKKEISVIENIEAGDIK